MEKISKTENIKSTKIEIMDKLYMEIEPIEIQKDTAKDRKSRKSLIKVYG